MKEELKKQYDDIEILVDYHQKVQDAIDYGYARKRKTRKYWGLKLSVSSCLLLLLLLNTNLVFAKAISDIPYIGDICKIFTILDLDQVDETKIIHVNAPQLTNTGNDDLERKVNNEIQSVIEREVKEATHRAREYYQSFIETSGKSEEFIPVTITIDYSIQYHRENFVSFLVEKTETLASSYQEYLYYNIDLNHGKVLSLQDLLGKDYVNIIEQEIKQQIDWYPEDEKYIFFEDVKLKDFINQNRIFYINKQGQIVIKFKKYEIAVGVAGPLEFIMPQDIFCLNQIK